MKRKIANLFALVLGLSLCSCAGKEDAIKINGVLLEKYTIVYDEDNIFSKYCAENLSSLLLDKTNCELTVVSDSEEESEYEILIGETNRSESQEIKAIALADTQYICSAEQNKLVMYANGYMVGGAANHLVNEVIAPELSGKTAKITYSQNRYPFTYEFDTAENAILMIGDGMGDNHITAAIEEFEISEFYASYMPNIGKATTYSYSVYANATTATDSAAAATALATGHKTVNSYLGMNEKKENVKNVREVAQEKGAKTAILTTDVITGATPTAFIVHGVIRDQTEVIQGQIDEKLANGTLTIAQGDVAGKLRSKTKSALEEISKGDAKYFAMIEEGYIDKQSHSRNKRNMFKALERFNDTIAYVMEFTLMHPNTALIITADHETGGVTMSEESDIWVYTTSEHTNRDVSVFAMGAGTEYFADKTVDNIDIAKFIAQIYGGNNFGGASLL